MIATNTPEFIAYISSLKPKTPITLECPQCNEFFIRIKNVIQSKFGTHNAQKIIYCSHKCATEAEITKQKVNCLQCGVVFKKFLNDTIRSPNHFCSKSCAGKYNNAHKTKGNKRSKLEKWLEERLKIIYPALEIKYNYKEIINSELDIYVPSLNIAFELNGIFHYEPIFGQKKLLSIKNNDERKFQACLEKILNLY